MSRLFLVRHGPTHAKSMVGWSDLPADLSDTDALARLSAFLPSEAQVVSSDLIRAVDTATALQANRPRLPHIKELREMHFGDWELKHHTEIDDQEHLMAFWDKPGDIRPPNGENWNAFSTRVYQATDQLLASCAGEDLIVVCHFGVIVALIQRAQSLTAYQAFAHRISNLSVTEIQTHPKWAAGVINHNP